MGDLKKFKEEHAENQVFLNFDQQELDLKNKSSP